MRRIAVLRALQLGDVLVAIPALRALRERFPEAEISFIGLPWASVLAARYPRYIDRVLPFPGWPGLDEIPFDARRARPFLRAQERYAYDLAVQLHGSGPQSSLFVKALGAKTTIGWCHPGQERELTIEPPYPEGIHEIDRWLRLIGFLGARTDRRDLEWRVTPAERARARAVLGPLPRPWIVVHTGARHRARRWPPSRFAAAARALRSLTRGGVVLTGSASERRRTGPIAARLGAPVLDLAGRTGIGDLGAVVALADLVVTNDTGVSHLAVATGTPSVVLWGDADLERWAPLDRDRHIVLRGRTGVAGIGVDEVVEVAAGLIARRAAA